ncbi:MAG: monooxygenase [Ktedonobacteraceae bacterium]|nr:monooxygenase [Ktedonobacteraceae bacterium]
MTVLPVHIRGEHLPGLQWEIKQAIHLGIQRKKDVVDLVSGNAAQADFFFTLDLLIAEQHRDFRGPYVQGKVGDRFIYLSWGEVKETTSFELFRRAKLDLEVIDAALLAHINQTGQRLLGCLSLTDDKGGPLCARIRPPRILWSSESISGS